jgi:hypothetical protein
MKKGKSFHSKAEPDGAVDDAVGGVKGNSEDIAKSIEGGDSRPGQLRIWDGVVIERVADVDGGDFDAITEVEEELVGGRGLVRDAGVR